MIDTYIQRSGELDYLLGQPDVASDMEAFCACPASAPRSPRLPERLSAGDSGASTWSTRKPRRSVTDDP